MSNDGSHARDTAGPFTAAERHAIDLTGPRSHTLVMEPGVGSLSIGPAARGRKVDLEVAPDERIDWSVFDAFAVPNGSPWPRFLRYTGSDAGFFDWARSRPIEKMEWCAVLPVDRVVDASRSQMRELLVSLETSGGHLRLMLPTRPGSPLSSLSLEGDLARLSVDGDVPGHLRLAPPTSRRRTDPALHLPDMGVLQRVEHLSLRNDPLAQPVSLRCLRRFPNLRSLSLWGNFCDLDQFPGQSRLTRLELRYMPDLSGLPALGT